MDEIKEPEQTGKKKSNITDKVRENPWVASTFVLAIVVVIMIVGSFAGVTGGVITGNAVSNSDVEGIFLDYLEGVGANTDYIKVTDITTEKGLYKISFDYQGEAYPVSYYMTKDASLIGVLSPLIEQASQQTSAGSAEIPKAERPVVDLFIWSYCPYGVQAQAPLAEVAELLGDYADFNAVLYYDGHGPHETQQNKIQACIQKYDSANYWEYAAGFVEEVYPKCSDVACNEEESVALMKSVGIDSDNIMDCVDSEGADLIQEDSQYAQQSGVSGSPTLVVNGVKVNTARTAEAFKGAICESFENAPSACSTELDSTAGTASGNC